MSVKLYRMAGVALVASAVLHLIYWPIHPPGHDVAQQLQPNWAPAHLIGLLSAVLLAVGLPAVYLRQADRIGWLGLIGAALGYLQVLGLVDLALYEALVVPVLAANPATQSLTAEGGVLAMGPLGVPGEAVWLGFMMLTSFGYLLFGLTTVRAGVLSRAGGLLVALSGTLHLALPFGFLFLFTGFVLRFAGFGWLGWSLLRSSQATAWAEATHPAAQGIHLEARGV